MVLESIQIIQDLAVVVVAALLMAALFRRLRQPLLVGYILAGIILGPYTPPFSLLLHPEILDLFAQIGIIFLLLAIGMEYPVSRLRAVGRPALFIALTETVATFAAGYAVGLGFHLSTFDSLFLGLALSVASTVILASVLGEMGVLGTGDAGLILGITIVEDIVAVSLLGVLQSFATDGRISYEAIGIATLLVVAFVGLLLTVGARFVPKLVDRVAATGRGELLLLTLLSLAFGLSIVSNLLGISVATGAFLAGVLVAESASQRPAKDLVTPLKELFGAIFFVSIGALMDFTLLPSFVWLIAALLAVSVTAKACVTYLGARAQRIDRESARRASLSVSAPRGELSLVVAKGGADVRATSPFVLPTVGILVLLTSIFAPFLVRLAWRRRPEVQGIPAPVIVPAVRESASEPE